MKVNNKLIDRDSVKKFYNLGISDVFYTLKEDYYSGLYMKMESALIVKGNDQHLKNAIDLTNCTLVYIEPDEDVVFKDVELVESK